MREPVRLSAAGPSTPPSASRPDAAAHESTAAGLCDRPPRSALPPLLPPPPAPRHRPVGRSVSQSVIERAAREQWALTASLGKERRAWGGVGGGG